MESHVDSDNAVFWVKVNDSLETDPQTIYIYYGKAATATTSDPNATLIYFHNFEGETVGQPPTKFLETTNLTIQADTVEGTRCVQNSGAGNGPFERMDMVNNAGVCLDAKMKNSGNFQASMCLRYVDGSNYIQVGGIYGNPATYWGVGQLVGGVWTDTHTAFTWGTGWHDVQVKIYGSSVTALIDATSVTKSDLTLLSAAKGAVRQWNSVTAWFDYIRIRKYCSPEPVQHTWGNEEVPAVAHYLTITEIIGCIDSKSRSKTINRTYSELLGLTDSKSRIKSYFRTVTELLGLKDSKSRVKSYYRTITELLGVKDTRSRVKSYFRTVTELLGLKDTRSRRKTINRVITEILGIKDFPHGIPVPPVISATIGKIKHILLDKFLGWLEQPAEDNPRVQCDIKVSWIQTNRVASSIRDFFTETISIKAKVAHVFTETMPITSAILHEFTETVQIRSGIIQKFEETVHITGDLMKAVIEDGFKVFGEVTPLLEKLRELKRRIEEN